MGSSGSLGLQATDKVRGSGEDLAVVQTPPPYFVTQHFFLRFPSYRPSFRDFRL